MLFSWILRSLCRKRTINYLPDELCGRLQYYGYHGSFPDLDNPRTFNEKILWYKLFYHDSLMTMAADKLGVRALVKERGLSHILNELYGVYSDVDQIQPEKLPEKFVLKATHGWNMNTICSDKSSLDWRKEQKKIRKWLKINWYWKGKQWAYKNIQPQIVCEKFLHNEEFNDLLDYKFYCYNGKPEVLFICAGRQSSEGVGYDAFDMEWNRIPVFKGKPAAELNVPCPENLAEMIEITKTLCAGFPFVRVDLYNVDQRILFGELTFYPDNGKVPFSPEKYNDYFGDFFQLPEKRCEI